MTAYKVDKLPEGLRLPLIVRPAAVQRLGEVIAAHREAFEAQLLSHGALLFRGFAVNSIEDFDRAIEALGGARMNYLNGSSPRSALGKGIFTSTEHPAALAIELHNECAYQRQWPLKIAFCCLTPARTGGETPIADMRAVTADVDGETLDGFEARGVCYLRHFRPHVDVPWQSVFQTEDRMKLAQICLERDIAHEWLEDQLLRTWQVCQGTAHHPRIGERLLFNQAHVFHVSSHSEEESEALVEIFGIDRLPKHCCYGDGSPISTGNLSVVRKALQRHAISFRWQAGDVLLLDNMQVAHGRSPYSGERRVIAALLEPYSLPLESALYARWRKNVVRVGAAP